MFNQSVLKALKISDNRTIVLWTNDLMGPLFEEALTHLHTSVKYLIFEPRNEINCYNSKYSVRTQYELLYENPTDIYVIVAINYRHRVHKKIFDWLIDCGFKYNSDFKIITESGFSYDCDCLDSLLGYTRKDANFSILPAYNPSNAIDCYLLGGSTTDQLSPTTPWAEFLFNRINKFYNLNMNIHNGGMKGYRSGQELLKLLRDVIPQKPSIVISFSGVNDFRWSDKEHGYAFTHPFTIKCFDAFCASDIVPESLDMRGIKSCYYGVEDTEPEWLQWINNQRTMHAICNEYGIKFFGFLQPMLSDSFNEYDPKWRNFILNCIYGDYNDPYAEEWIERSNLFLSSCEAEMTDKPYLISLRHIFDGKSGMFYDQMHATDEGNRIIGETIADIVAKQLIL